MQELDRTEKPERKRHQRGKSFLKINSTMDNTKEIAETRLQPKQRERLVAQLVSDFSSHVDQLDLAKAWHALLALKRERREAIGIRGGILYKKVQHFMRKMVLHYVTNLGTNAGGGATVPTPSTFILQLRGSNLLFPALRSELLWRLSNTLFMRINNVGDIDQASQSLALDELVFVWYECFKAKIQPSMASTSNLTDLSQQDWSILPSTSSLTNKHDGSQMQLHDVLALLVPTSNIDKNLPTVADYPSSLLVTIDLLNAHMSALKDGHSSNAVVGQWQPFVTFVNEILGRTIRPSVPPALKIRLEQSQDPLLDHYESLVRRLNLADIPEKRTDRSKAEREPQNTRINELGQPLQKQQSNLRRSNGVEKASDSDIPQSADAENGTPAAMNNEALIQAGYSVQENFSMDRDIHRKCFGWMKRLTRAIETSNLLIAETCWEQAVSLASENTGESSLPLFLYEHFMLAFLALRQPKMAIEVWNAVLKAGLQPTVKTWTVMMRGCSQVRDTDMMEMFWSRMRAQGFQPDQHAWSVRLYGLIKKDRIETALSNLHEMGQEWITAVRNKQKTALPATPAGKQGKTRQLKAAPLPAIDLTEWDSDVDGVPRPNLVIVNTAVSALASMADDQIPNVLSWARDFAIELDLTTYNALLNVSMRHGKTAQTLSLLKIMQDRAIEPNSTTTTVMLTALFKSDYFVDLDAEEQTTKLFDMIAAIESSSPNLKLDTKGYALAIDRMLKLHNNSAAARALLEHMSSRDLQPTAHIYTILMTSYFDADPPDFAAAEALWSHIENTNSGYGAALDTIFYDRMVEAYAHHHAHVGVAPMMQFLGRMSREGKRPSWPMLEAVARALTERNEFGRLHGLVADIRESKGLVRVGVKGLVGQNEFWDFILSTGILDSEGVRDVQELRINVGSSSFRYR